MLDNLALITILDGPKTIEKYTSCMLKQLKGIDLFPTDAAVTSLVEVAQLICLNAAGTF